jgi:phenylacetate-CoA ligase
MKSDCPTEWESTAWESMQSPRQALWEKQWTYLWDSSEFYRNKFAAAGFNSAKTPDLRDLSALPVTVKEEMRASLDRSPPLGEHLAAPRSAIRQIQTSSGTTGRPMAIALTKHDADMFAEILRRGYVAIGFRPEDTILHAFSMSRGWIGGLCMVQGYLKLGCTLLPIGAEAGRDKILELMQIFRPTGISATPGFLMTLGERALEHGIEPASLGLRHMLTGGEPGGGIPEIKQRLSSMWGATLREVMGGTDVTPICWAECEHEQGMHFIGADAVSFEIVDPDTNQPKLIEEGVVGELVYTHLRREATPVVRFKHRDIVKVTGVGRCSCGRQTPQIRCIGRADDMLIVRGVNLFPSAIRAMLSEVAGVGPEFRIVRPKGQYTLPGPVQIKVECNPDAEISADELARLLHHKLSVAFTVSFVAPGATSVAGAHKSSYFEDA